MRKLTIYEFFEQYGYIKEQVQEIIKGLTERQIEYLKTRNGNDLDNPVYIGNLDPNQRSQYASTLKIIMKRLTAKYGKSNEHYVPNDGTEETPIDNQKETLSAATIKKRGKPKKSIIEKFKEQGYTKEEIGRVIETLPEKHRNGIKIMDGEDLENPVKNPTVTKQDREFYYGTILPTIERRLKKTYGKKIHEEVQEKTPVPKTIIQEITNEEKESPEEVKTPVTLTNIEIRETSTEESLTQEEYIKILELIKTPTFAKLMTQLNTKSAIIIALRLGYVDGKYFSSESIASFLGIETKEVIETTKEVLNLYKENINDFIDKAISYEETETKGTGRKLALQNQ